MRLSAEGRSRGMKTVVFDRVCNFSDGKAPGQVPVFPGSDGTSALALCNVIIKKSGICDEEYIKWKTDEAYLIKGDGHYLRDDESNKPLIWNV